MKPKVIVEIKNITRNHGRGGREQKTEYRLCEIRNKKWGIGERSE